MKWFVLCLCLVSAPPVHATHDLSTAHRLLTLVDYLVNDYGGAVEDGAIINRAEHLEHLSLVSEALEIVRELPPATADTRIANGPDGALAADPLPPLLGQLQQSIRNIAPAAEIERLGRSAHDLLVARYQLPTFPRTNPDLARGEALFRHNCAACHGDDGSAATDIAARLDPRPRRFDDAELSSGLSPHRVFNGVSFGIRGTAMPSFGENVSEQERWDIAFFVLALRQADPDATTEAMAAADFARAGLSASVADLAIRTDGELVARALDSGLDAAGAARALAFARRRAPALPPEAPLDLARRLLGESAAAVREGRYADASRKALDAYLLGVEPVEGLLRAVDAPLTSAIETGFVELREAIRARLGPAAIAAKAEALDRLLATARETENATGGSPWYAFLGALAILLREGVEAALIVGAILAMLRKAAPELPALRRSVHLAWVLALGLGVATWAAAETALDISPGQREAAEGVIALVAAALLFSASYWLLANREVARWMGFLKQKVESSARRPRGAISLFLIAFFAVYREVFETVLFLQALLLGAPGARLHAVAGIVVGAVALGALIALLFRVGARVPLKPFFALSSLLLALLSFVLAGQGIHALQQAGMLPAPSVALPALPSLGFHPTWPGIAVQGAIVMLFALASLYSFVLQPRRTRGQASR